MAGLSKDVVQVVAGLSHSFHESAESHESVHDASYAGSRAGAWTSESETGPILTVKKYKTQVEN